MSGETGSSQEKTKHEDDTAALAPEVIERIKHPPAIDDVLRELSPEELISNPAVAPEMLQEGSDLRHDLKGDY